MGEDDDASVPRPPTAPLSREVMLAIAVYLTVVGLTSTVGNSIFATVLRHRLKTISDGQTLLLLNSALCDLGVSITGYPYTTISSYAGRWIFEHLLKPSLAKRCLVAAWLYGLAWSTPPLLGWSRYVREPFETSCSTDWYDRSLSGIAYSICLVVFCYSVHVTCLAICYQKILYKSRQLQLALPETNPKLSLHGGDDINMTLHAQMAVLARLQKSPVDPCRQEEDSSSEHRNMCSITLMDDNPPADAKNGQCSRDCHHSKNEDETGMVEVIMNPKLCHDPTTSTSSSSSSAENRSPGDNSGRSASGSKQKSPFKEDSDKEESVQISVTALFTKNTSKTGDDGKPSREETVIVTNSTSSVITTDSTTVSQVKH
ncbi:hypothetical protein C7M84_019413 [Penaeus vannamei]|uniref:G-protein coupled receptors family 1 profile domain-containing protein n=1 Tax=Penaeus vannamei TaxID=6689 RepID=A0A3R7PE24_PENVA|nr:hypothetical protein C7M84_019413 [Penaeus vannamei]